MASKFFKEFVVKPAVKKVKSILTGGKQKTTGTEVISSVKPKVNKTKLEEARSSLNIAIQKGKSSTSRLGHTRWQIKTGDHKKSGFTFDPGKKNVPKKSKKKDSRKWDQALREYVKK